MHLPDRRTPSRVTVCMIPKDGAHAAALLHASPLSVKSHPRTPLPLPRPLPRRSRPKKRDRVRIPLNSKEYFSMNSTNVPGSLESALLGTLLSYPMCYTTYIDLHPLIV